MKKCSSCQCLFPLSAFNKNARKSDGLQTACKSCTKLASKKHYTGNKQKYIDRKREYKKTLRLYIIERLKPGCIDCGEKDPVVLDFDHLSNKKMGINELVTRGAKLADINEEISKCVIRCSNCHRRKTAKENNWLRLMVSSSSPA